MGKFVGLTVRMEGKSFEQTKLEVKAHTKNLGDDLIRLAVLLRDNMRNIISTEKTRDYSSNRLEHYINFETNYGSSLDTFVGVGNIDVLDKNAPYWAIINWGGMVPPKARKVVGSFGNGNPPNPSLAGTGVGTEAFYRDGQFLMIVRNPIKAFNYIERSESLLSVALDSIVRKVVNY